jgi:hypothetical protein
MNLRQIGLISLDRVAENIITCFSLGVSRKIFWMSSRMSVIGFAAGEWFTELLEALVTFVQDEELHLVELEYFFPDESKDAPRSADEDMRRCRLEHLFMHSDRLTSVDDFSLDIRHVLGEPSELVLDLVGQLVRVTNDDSGDGIGLGFHTVEHRQHKDRRFAHTGLSLSQHVRAEECLRETFLLN